MLLGTGLYYKKLEQLEKWEQMRVKEFYLQLIENGDLVGDPLGVV